MLYLVLGDKTGKSNTGSVGTNSIPMPAGRGKLCSLEREAPSSAERFSCTRGLGRPQFWEGKSQPRESRVGGRGVPAVRHFPGWIPGKSNLTKH